MRDGAKNVLQVDCPVAATLCHHVKPNRDSSVTIVTTMLTGQQTNIAGFPARGKRVFF